MSGHAREAERDTAKGELGPARRFLSSLRGRPLVLSIVTVEELLEGAADEAAALASLQRFSIQGLHLAQARQCALLQHRATRRMGENVTRASPCFRIGIDRTQTIRLPRTAHR
jgi:hypothetical protein